MVGLAALRELARHLAVTKVAASGPPPNTSAIPMHHIGEPSEVGNLVVFLTSDEASFSTGSEFIIDGGQTAGHNLLRSEEQERAAS
jgi:NAD(P)-dependent dehydrogenase (short-subunit alcohol dehydrogenase family)